MNFQKGWLFKLHSHYNNNYPVSYCSNFDINVFILLKKRLNVLAIACKIRASEYKTGPKGKSILVVETNVTGILKYCFVSKLRFFHLYFILCHNSMGFWSDGLNGSLKYCLNSQSTQLSQLCCNFYPTNCQVQWCLGCEKVSCLHSPGLDISCA